MAPWVIDLAEVGVAMLLVAVNGFFVAAEFALVKVRGSQIEELVTQGRPFSRTAKWLAERLEHSLSACQLGITMASLALGWVGEPAFSRLLEPVLHGMGVQSETVIRTVGFTVAFTLITALHLVIGEQAPKIFAIRRPEQMVLWCAVPMKFFFLLSYPLLVSLNYATSFILTRLGVSSMEHETPHSEEEIRALLREAHIHGDMTRSEHRLIDAVFEFDDMVCRRIMVPRSDVEIFTLGQSLADCLVQVKRTRHTRFPLCDGSLDHVVGIVHIKDLIGKRDDGQFDLKRLARPPRSVPENMAVSRLLRHFQASRQHMALVVDEYGTTIGIVTLENVIEQIVGAVQDEFDVETPEIVPDGPGQYIVQGSTPVEVVEKVLKLKSSDADVDTFSGLLMTRHGKILEAGDKISLEPGIAAEVLEVRGARAERVRVTIESAQSPASPSDKASKTSGH